MQELRFAFHSMNADDIVLEHNVSRGNALGFAFMFSRRITATDNLSDGDATHGLFFNSVTNSRLIHNEVRAGGDKCLFVYGATRNRIEGNVCNRNESTGISVLNSATNNMVVCNMAVENGTDYSVSTSLNIMGPAATSLTNHPWANYSR